MNKSLAKPVRMNEVTISLHIKDIKAITSLTDRTGFYEIRISTIIGYVYVSIVNQLVRFKLDDKLLGYCRLNNLKSYKRIKLYREGKLKNGNTTTNGGNNS
jgi:hypothetical protein